MAGAGEIQADRCPFCGEFKADSGCIPFDCGKCGRRTCDAEGCFGRCPDCDVLMDDFDDEDDEDDDE